MDSFNCRLQVVAASALTLSLIGSTVQALADPLIDAPTAQRKSRQKETLKELRHEDQINRLNRDQRLSESQRQLDERKGDLVPQFHPGHRLEVKRLQRQLDAIKIDQRLKQALTELQLEQIYRESDPLRQGEALRELQRQQQLDFLQDQQRKLQTGHGLDRLRNRHSIR